MQLRSPQFKASPCNFQHAVLSSSSSSSFGNVLGSQASSVTFRDWTSHKQETPAPGSPSQRGSMQGSLGKDNAAGQSSAGPSTGFASSSPIGLSFNLNSVAKQHPYLMCTHSRGSHKLPWPSTAQSSSSDTQQQCTAGVAEGSAPPAAVRASLSSPNKQLAPQLRSAHSLNGKALPLTSPGASALPASLLPGRLGPSPQATPQDHTRAQRQCLGAQACCSLPPAGRARSAAAARQCQGQDTCAAGPAPGTLAAQPECHQGQTHERPQTTPLKRLLGFLGFGTPPGSRDRHTKGQLPPLKRARLASSPIAKGVGSPMQAAQSTLSAASPCSSMAALPARRVKFSTVATSHVREPQVIMSSLQPAELSPRQLQDLASLSSLPAAHGSPGSAAGSPKHLQQTSEAQGSPCAVAVAAAGARVAEALMSEEWSTGSQPRPAQAEEPDPEERWVGHWAAALAALDASPASISSGMMLRAEAHAHAQANPAADQPGSLQPGAQAGTICAAQDASSQAAAAAPPVKSVSLRSGSPGHHGHAGLDVSSQTSDAQGMESLGEAVPQVSRTSAVLGGKQDSAEAAAPDGPGSMAAAAGRSTETEMQVQCLAEVISPSRRFRRLRARPGSRGLVFVRQ